MYYRLILMIIFMVMLTTCDNPEIENNAPIASFITTPVSGDTETYFSFDASTSSDAEDETSQLEVRWDWENDSIWDTDYTTTKTITHQFSVAATYNVNMEVRDSDGDIANTTRNISVSEVSSVTDIDGNIYEFVQIGDQIWMAENLKVTHYQNGDVIPKATDDSSWTATTDGAYCFYDNEDSNGVILGALYNWYAINDDRNIAPAGWRVPTDAEWETLVTYVDNNGGKLKETGTNHWSSPNIDATNESGFTAIAAGYRDGSIGRFLYASEYGCFWTATDDSLSHRPWAYKLHSASTVIFHSTFREKQYGFSVRCIKD